MNKGRDGRVWAFSENSRESMWAGGPIRKPIRKTVVLVEFDKIQKRHDAD